ncbi:MAG: methanogenic corrinoid protein MtbC1 [Planctomycetota bacterium]|jgi:methanogenic corrinoid protein MtbC1
MTRATAFTAELIETSARGLSGLTVARAYERSSELDARYGGEGFETWRHSVTSRLESLAAALASADPKVFSDDLLWFRSLSTSRGIPPADLLLVLDCMEDVLAEQLPGNVPEAVSPYFEAARSAISEEPSATGGLEPDSPADQLFQLALIGDMGAARRHLLDQVQGGQLTLEDAVLEVLLPAAREAGRRWHVGEMGVATEHVVTATLRSALHSLAAALPPPPQNGHAVFVAAVPGDAHDTGLIAFALLLEQDGWRVALSGADTPIDEIDATAEGYQCQVIALSATLPGQRPALIRYLQDRKSSIPVVVGGAAIRSADDAKAIGAHGYAPNLAAGVGAVRALVDN